MPDPVPPGTAADSPVPSAPSSSPCLQGERVTFTGTLASMTHRAARELVETHGGTTTDHPSGQTTLVVVGEEGWPLEADGRPSRDFLHALALQEAGRAIRVLRESEWLYLLGLEERRPDATRQFTPAMLSQLLDVPVATIRAWERRGLIRPVRRVLRLPYFDFLEVQSARRLTDLVAAGVPVDEISASLERLRAVLPDVDRPLSQLQLLARAGHVLYRDAAGLVEPQTGQRFLPFSGEGRGDALGTGPDGTWAVRSANDRRHEPGESDEGSSSEGSASEEVEPSIVRLEPAVRPIPADAEAAFVEGERRLAEDDAVGAIAAFRQCLRHGSREALVQFRLAEALYRTGQVEASRERYFAAVECDPEFLEGWTQLGCVLVETGDAEGACAAFGTALALHPDHAEAHFHLAEVHHGAGRTDAAATHWRRYLEFDQVGPWAQHVRDRLEQCGFSVEPPSR